MDVNRLPETWITTSSSDFFSLRGRYDYVPLVALQLCTNSDISLVYQMIQHRYRDLLSRLSSTTDGLNWRGKEFL
jgi:hypothetical protein